MLLTIRTSTGPTIKVSTIKPAWYHAQIFKVFPVQPTKYNTEGQREYGIIYSLLSKTGTYEAYAETFQIVTGPTSTLLKLLIAVTGKRLTSKALEGRQFDPDDLTGKHLSILFQMNDRGSPRIAERQARLAAKCPPHDFTVAQAYTLPSWIRPETTTEDTSVLEDVAEDVDVGDLLKGVVRTPIAETAPTAQPEKPEGTLSDILGFDCSKAGEPDPSKIVIDTPVKDVEIDLKDFDIA